MDTGQQKAPSELERYFFSQKNLLNKEPL